MNLYLDKANLLSILSISDTDFRSNCIKAMRSQLDVYFNFSKSDVSASEELSSLFKVLTSGVESTRKGFLDNKIPDRPINDNLHEGMSFKKLVSMYLVEDSNATKVKNLGSVNLGEVGEEHELFDRMFLLRRNFFFEKKLRIGTDFSRWGQLSDYSFPLTDMLIIDSFILNDDSLIESNLLEIIEVFGARAKKCFNILIYTNSGNVSRSINLENLKNRIKKKVSTLNGIVPNVSIITVRDQRGIRSLAEHDRTILTNSYRIYSGDSFNYFDSNRNKITKGREMSFSSFGDKDNYRLACLLIEDIQAAILSLDPRSIAGDKISNIFKFPS